MGTIELDLHGYKWSDAMQEFIRVYNGAVDTTQELKSLQIVVIHGYGSTGEGGVIRHRLRAFLEHFPASADFTPGEETIGNQGCTVVKPLAKLPISPDMLEEQIAGYCERPRTKNTIAGKFRRHGDRRVADAIQTLMQQGRLCKTQKNNRIAYKTR